MEVEKLIASLQCRVETLERLYAELLVELGEMKEKRVRKKAAPSTNTDRLQLGALGSIKE